tara:strand:+ start:3573 stop:3917 length:345 start_codon:yes stop_codon:yes gene_type:complete
MKKNIPFLKYTTIDLIPCFDYHVNDYTWSILKDALNVDSWDEVVKVEQYIIDECPDYPNIFPLSDREELDVSSIPHKLYKCKIWGTDSVEIQHLDSEERYASIFYVSINDLGLW